MLSAGYNIFSGNFAKYCLAEESIIALAKLMIEYALKEKSFADSVKYASL